MAANTAYGRSTGSPLPLNPGRERGWIDGFGNLFRNENALWWRTRRWLVHVLLWTLLVNGLLAAALFAPQEAAASPPVQQGAFDPNDPLFLGSILLFVVGGLATGIGAIIIMQGVILDEKKSGTAAWLLSKPVSRAAFVLAKWSANVLASILLLIVLQGALAYVVISARIGNALPVGPFAVGISLLGLNLLFYLSLTLMLSTLFDGRGAVLGIPLGVLFGAQLGYQIAPWLSQIMPWLLIVPPNGNDALSMLAMRGQPLTSVTPILATAVWIVIFVGVSVWRFKREEF